MNIQTTLKTINLGRPTQETESGAGVQLIKEKDIVDESEPAPFSTPRKKRWTAMTKLVEAMAPLWSIYDANAERWRRSTSLSLERFLEKM